MTMHVVGERHREYNTVVNELDVRPLRSETDRISLVQRLTTAVYWIGCPWTRIK